MKLSHLCLLVLGVMLLWGCSNRSSSPILIERGVGQNEYEREYFAIKESMGIDKRLTWASTSASRTCSSRAISKKA